MGLLAIAFLAACETTTPITPTATMKPALAERLAVITTDEPMPPAEGPEDVAPGPSSGSNAQPRPCPFPAFALFGGVNDALMSAAVFESNPPARGFAIRCARP
jgi:hypothetical protein